jgi:hypothetical protein
LWSITAWRWKRGFEALRARAASLKEGLALYDRKRWISAISNEAVEIVCDGVLTFAERLAQAAEQQALTVADENRRAELRRIAADCARFQPNRRYLPPGADHGVVCAPDSTNGKQRALGVAGAL